MPNKNFWLCAKAMAAFLDEKWDLEGVALDHLCVDLEQLPPAERSECRRELTLIITQLSRLEMRMVEKSQSSSPR